MADNGADARDVQSGPSTADRLREWYEAATVEVYLGNDDVQTNFVSREMALDAGIPEVEGQPFIESVPVYGRAWMVEPHLASRIIDAIPALIALIEAWGRAEKIALAKEPGGPFCPLCRYSITTCDYEQWDEGPAIRAALVAIRESLP